MILFVRRNPFGQQRHQATAAGWVGGEPDGFENRQQRVGRILARTTHADRRQEDWFGPGSQGADGRLAVIPQQLDGLGDEFAFGLASRRNIAAAQLGQDFDFGLLAHKVVQPPGHTRFWRNDPLSPSNPPAFGNKTLGADRRFTDTRLSLDFTSGGATLLSVAPITSLSPGSRRILLVDDEPLVLDSIRRLLQFDGHLAEVAASGEQALALFQKSAFDLVITDYEMPGMQGDELAAALKAILPLQPVLMVSAYGEQLRTASDPLSAVDAILTKPFQVEELRQAIATLLSKTVNIPSAQSGRDNARPRLRP